MIIIMRRKYSNSKSTFAVEQVQKCGFVLLFVKVIYMKVLVLCQRKSGWAYAGQMDGEDVYKKIEKTVAPKIDKLVRSLIGDEYDIEYLSSFTDEHSTGKLDIEGFLKNDTVLTLKGNEKIAVRDFVKQNAETYDIILLNTCPWQQMDFQLISQLLKANGRMVFTAYSGSGRKVNVKRMMDIPTKFFTLADTQGDEVLIYTKKQTPDKKTSSPPSSTTPPYKKGGRRRTTTFKKGCAKHRSKTFKTTFKKGCAKHRSKTFKKCRAKELL